MTISRDAGRLPRKDTYACGLGVFCVLPAGADMDDTEDDRRIRGWLDLWLEASARCQTDVAVEAAAALDHLLRQPVKL